MLDRPTVTAALAVIVVVQSALLYSGNSRDRVPPPCMSDATGQVRATGHAVVGEVPSLSPGPGTAVPHEQPAEDPPSVLAQASLATTAPPPALPPTPPVSEAVAAGADDALPPDCTSHLLEIAAARMSAARKKCDARMAALVQRELDYVARNPKFKWKRAALQQPPDYMQALDCVGLYPVPNPVQIVPSHWDERYPPAEPKRGRFIVMNTSRANSQKPRPTTRVTEWSLPSDSTSVIVGARHPLLFPLHGGVGAKRLIEQSRFLGRLLGVLDDVDALAAAAPDADVTLPSGRKDLVIAELGAGHGALLYALCPPHPKVRCYGSDFAAELVDRGNAALADEAGERISLSRRCFAPQVPTGTAAGVISHAVMTYLFWDAACRHVAEALRMLQGGGRAAFWMLNRRWQGSRYSPTFFVRTATDAAIRKAAADESPHVWARNATGASDADVLPFCSHELGRYVETVSVFFEEVPGGVIYHPGRETYFGVVIERRHGAPWTPLKSELPAALPRMFAADSSSEPLPDAQRRKAAVRLEQHRRLISAGLRMTVPVLKKRHA